MKYFMLLGAAVFALLQIVPSPYRLTFPGHDASQSVSADPDVPAQVLKVLNRACMDCHSNQTRLPWYGRVAPASWLLAKDVSEARQAVNLSTWSSVSPALRLAIASAACADVKNARMPKPQYILMHPEARLSEADVDTLCQWQKAALSALVRKKRQGDMGPPDVANP